MFVFVLWGGGEFLMSNYFSILASRHINKLLKIKMKDKAHIEFKKLKINMLPLETHFEDVSIKLEIEGIKTEIDKSKVSFRMSYWDLLLSRLHLDRILISNGSLLLSSSNKLEEKSGESKDISNENLKNLYKKIKKILDEDLPFTINELALKNYELEYDNFGLSIADIIVANKKKKIHLSGVTSLSYSHHVDSTPIYVDEVSFNIDWNQKEILLDNLSVKSEIDEFSYRGRITNDRKVEGQYHIQTTMSKLYRYYPELQTTIGVSGIVFVDGKVKGDLSSLNWNLNVDIRNLKSRYIESDRLKVSLSLLENKAHVESVDLYEKGGVITLKSTIPVYDLVNKKILVSKIPLSLKGVNTSTVFKFLQGKLESLKGKLTGDMNVHLGKRNEIDVLIPEELEWANFKLEGSNGSILDVGDLTLSKSKIEVQENGEIDLHLNLKKEGIDLTALGSIGEEIDIKIKDGLMDLESFGPISGAVLKGKGPLDLKIKGPFEKVLFFFDADLDETEIVSLSLGSIKSKFIFDLSNTTLEIKRAYVNKGKTSYTASGVLDFDNGNIDMGVEFSKGYFDDLKKILKPAIDLDSMGNINTNNFFFKSSFSLNGEMDLDKMKIGGWIDAEDISSYESLDKFYSKVMFVNKKLTLTDTILLKGEGSLKGLLVYDIPSDYVEYDFLLSKLSLRELKFYRGLNFSLEGLLKGHFYGSGQLKDFSSKGKVHLYDTHVNMKKYSESILEIYGDGGLLNFQGNIFDDLFEIKGSFNTKETKAKSYVKMKYNIPDINVLMGAFSSDSLYQNDIEGSVKGSMSSHFDLKNPRNADVDIKFDNLIINEGSKKLKLISGKNNFLIKKGVIQANKVSLRGELGEVDLWGEGKLKSNFSLKNNFRINASVFKLFSSKLEHLSGWIKGNAEYTSRGDFDNTHSFNILGSNLSAKIKKVPGFFKDINFNFTGDNEEISIHNILAKYGDGNIEGSGKIILKVPVPEINTTFLFNNNKIHVSENSSIILGGEGSFSGKKLPYDLKGTITVLHGQFRDEFQDLIPGKGRNSSYDRFIPKSKANNQESLFKSDVSIKIARPIIIKNNLVEVYFTGGLQMSGEVSQLNMNGGFSVIPGTSKLSFKGNDFILSKGDISLKNEHLDTLVGLDFLGSSNIGRYKVNLAVSGEAKKPEIVLTSDPYLSQEDILSLLTIGVTGEMSKDLKAEERSSLTALGLGTLLMDQLSFDKGLNSSLGLKVTVSPEFREDETSLIQGKSAVSTNSTSKVKSATKIKIRKKLAKKVNLSVSSTVGGSLEQTQEMNINFNLTNKLSIEGGVEVRSTEQSSSLAPTSVGVDVKYKGSFR